MKRAWKTLERVKYRAKDGEKKRERGTRGRRKGMNAWGSVGGGEGVEKVGNGISRARVEDKMAGTEQGRVETGGVQSEGLCGLINSGT